VVFGNGTGGTSPFTTGGTGTDGELMPGLRGVGVTGFSWAAFTSLAVPGRVGKLSTEVAVVRVGPTVGGIWESLTIPTGSASEGWVSSGT